MEDERLYCLEFVQEKTSVKTHAAHPFSKCEMYMSMSCIYYNPKAKITILNSHTLRIISKEKQSEIFVQIPSLQTSVSKFPAIYAVRC